MSILKASRVRVAFFEVTLTIAVFAGYHFCQSLYFTSCPLESFCLAFLILSSFLPKFTECQEQGLRCGHNWLWKGNCGPGHQAHWWLCRLGFAGISGHRVTGAKSSRPWPVTALMSFRLFILLLQILLTRPHAYLYPGGGSPLIRLRTRTGRNTSGTREY